MSTGGAQSHRSGSDLGGEWGTAGAQAAGPGPWWPRLGAGACWSYREKGSRPAGSGDAQGLASPSRQGWRLGRTLPGPVGSEPGRVRGGPGGTGDGREEPSGKGFGPAGSWPLQLQSLFPAPQLWGPGRSGQITGMIYRFASILGFLFERVCLGNFLHKTLHNSWNPRRPVLLKTGM